MRPESSSEGASIGLSLPVREDDLFKYGASQYVLNFLSDAPEIDVSIRGLAQVTPVSERATRQAVDALAGAGLVETFHEGNARRVRINRARLHRPTDPVESLPQESYRTPVRVAREYLRDELDDVLGIVLFGSVARGSADRQSDIDLWVLVEDELMAQRHAANKLARRLEEQPIPTSIGLSTAGDGEFGDRWPEIRERLEADGSEWASAERYSFEFVVETPRSILGQSDRVDPERLFGEGITLLSSDTLDRVKREVAVDE